MCSWPDSSIRCRRTPLCYAYLRVYTKCFDMWIRNHVSSYFFERNTHIHERYKKHPTMFLTSHHLKSGTVSYVIGSRINSKHDGGERLECLMSLSQKICGSWCIVHKYLKDALHIYPMKERALKIRFWSNPKRKSSTCSGQQFQQTTRRWM